ncbi:hypothetical protein ABEW81_26800 [Priestia megaterium]
MNCRTITSAPTTGWPVVISMTCPVIDDGFGSKAKLAIDCVSAIIVKLIIPLVNPCEVAMAVY